MNSRCQAPVIHRVAHRVNKKGLTPFIQGVG
jgi:hypothetical protein